jgi:hypothetical protein
LFSNKTLSLPFGAAAVAAVVGRSTVAVFAQITTFQEGSTPTAVDSKFTRGEAANDGVPKRHIEQNAKRIKIFFILKTS